MSWLLFTIVALGFAIILQWSGFATRLPATSAVNPPQIQFDISTDPAFTLVVSLNQQFAQLLGWCLLALAAWAALVLIVWLCESLLVYTNTHHPNPQRVSQWRSISNMIRWMITAMERGFLWPTRPILSRNLAVGLAIFHIALAWIRIIYFAAQAVLQNTPVPYQNLTALVLLALLAIGCFIFWKLQLLLAISAILLLSDQLLVTVGQIQLQPVLGSLNDQYLTLLAVTVLIANAVVRRERALRHKSALQQQQQIFKATQRTITIN